MLSPENKKKLDRFIQQIRRRQVVGSYDCARQTADLLRDILGTSNWRTAQDVLNLVREIGPTLAKANPAGNSNLTEFKNSVLEISSGDACI